MMTTQSNRACSLTMLVCEAHQGFRWVSTKLGYQWASSQQWQRWSLTIIFNRV